MKQSEVAPIIHALIARNRYTVDDREQIDLCGLQIRVRRAVNLKNEGRSYRHVERFSIFYTFIEYKSSWQEEWWATSPASIIQFCQERTGAHVN